MAAETTKKTLTADDIFGADDLKLESVDVPEWGGRVFVRQMSAGARDAYDVSQTDEGDKLNLTNFRSRLVAFTCCDEGGTLLFTQDQVEKLAAKSAAPLLRVFAAAKELNKVGTEALAGEKKDSAAAPSGASPTGSV
jgi:hypothetical protein